MVHFFSENLNQKLNPKIGDFGFFQLIKNYAETTLSIDKKSNINQIWEKRV